MANEIFNDERKELLAPFFEDTSALVKERDSELVCTTVEAFINSHKLVDDVEFYNWMNRNYSVKGMFSSSEAMQEYALTHEKYLKDSMLKGKGYEWDYMQDKRLSFKNLFKKYNLGDNPTQPGVDLIEKGIFNEEQKAYQMKAYLSSNFPTHKHTPDDAIVVTNIEKAKHASNQGFEVDAYKNNNIISADIDKRYDQMRAGAASSNYNIKNVAGTMMSSGLVGCAIGVCAETFTDYKIWKDGEISDKEYLHRILASGGDSGIVAGATSSILIPISAVITKRGLSALINIPVGFLLGAAIGKVVDPCFKRGEYKEILVKAKHYQEMDKLYIELIRQMKDSEIQSFEFARAVSIQKETYNNLREESREIDERLNSIYDSI